jgi:Na+-transporting NADH:ubiquinone oxidoreductase subunit B
MTPSLVNPLSPLVTHTAPHVRGLRTVRGMMLAFIVALLPCVVMAVHNTGLQANRAGAGGWRVEVVAALGGDPVAGGLWSSIVHGSLFLLPALAVSLVTAGLWAWVFGRLRGRRLGEDVAVTALIFTLILPPGAPLWQVALGMSFGVVLGKEVFGGTGRNFVHPALVGLAFLYLAFPNALAADRVWGGIAGYGGTSIFATVAAGGGQPLEAAGVTWWRSFIGTEQGAMGVTSTLACLIGAVVLLVTRTVSWRVMAGMMSGMIVAVYLCKLAGEAVGPIAHLSWYWHLTLGGFAFGAVFLATDPVTAAATNPGRWIYGVLIGGMVVVVRVGNPFHPDGVMMAVLLGNIFAPLIDYGVVWWHIKHRARRVGAP